jgi:hypothetical protein
MMFFEELLLWSSFLGAEGGRRSHFGLEEQLIAVIAADDFDDVAGFDVAA